MIAYRELPAVTVKGKAEPLAMWLATSIQPTVPERDEDDPPPFVGRDRERRQLHDLLDHAVESRRPHMATVVGEPGIGKTRLVSDLGEHVRAEGKDILFHRGRCLPYGESITFTALEEIVRALIGVGPGQDRRSVAEALERTLEELEPRPTERGWLSSRLAPLVGTSNPGDAPADRSESFAAWTRFLELVADTAPLAMVVEDLHWADPAMLEFLDHLVTEAREVPMFVLCTSRPELFAQHPSWGSGSAEVTTISLSPLSDEDMQVLLGALLLHSILPAEAREPLMRRAGGNPLYAREFVHMLEDRGEDGRVERDPDASGSGVRVPDTVQALIAARLDSLEPAERSLLQSASVVGDRFWPGVLAALDHPDDLDGSLRELQRRGMIRRSPLSTIPEQTEFAFTHGLIRDVAYGRLPRAARARMHLAVTVWLEETAGERLSERADLLASHATRALDLARAASLTEELPALQDAALRFLVMAGSRQKTLDTARAADYFARAAELAPAHGAERAELVRQATSTAWRAGRLTSDEAVAAYRESVAIALAAGDRETAARAMRRLYYQLGLQGETAAARTTLDQAIELLETADEPGLTLAELYACRSESEMFAGRSQESLDWAERALQLPRTEAVTLMGLHLRGNARCELGDLDGIADLHHALDVARGSGNALDMVTSYSYLCEWIGLLEGPTAALAMNREAIDLCSRRGLSGQESWARAEGMWLLFDLGEWDEIVATTDPPAAMGRRARRRAGGNGGPLVPGPRPRTSGPDGRSRRGTHRSAPGRPADRGSPGAGAGAAGGGDHRRRGRRSGRGDREVAGVRCDHGGRAHRVPRAAAARSRARRDRRRSGRPRGAPRRRPAGARPEDADVGGHEPGLGIGGPGCLRRRAHRLPVLGGSVGPMERAAGAGARAHGRGAVPARPGSVRRSRSGRGRRETRVGGARRARGDRPPDVTTVTATQDMPAYHRVDA